ncbi:MAG: hypothetical protein EOO91_07885 [Pedobacter sp.]|nr:MAG: hypothetical protein EOO91_07885 [Pedobacter sp.]
MCSANVKAQQDSTKTTTTTAALLYNSDISYYGQAATERYPYILANATVRFPFGLYLSAGGYQLLNYGGSLSEADLGLGYEHDFNDKWNSSVSYTRSFFPKSSPLLAAANENNFNLTTVYSGNWFKTSLAADYALGKQQDFFLTLTNSQEIDLGHFLSENNLISIEPAIEIVAGTRHFFETYVVEKEKRNNANGKAKGNTQTEVIYTDVAKNSFELLSYNFKIPLSLTTSNYMFEANYQFSILGSKSNSDLKSHNSIFGLAFYYQF